MTTVSLTKPVSLVREQPRITPKVSLVRQDERFKPDLDSDLLDNLLNAWVQRGGGTFFASCGCCGDKEDFIAFVEFRADDAGLLTFCDACNHPEHASTTISDGSTTVCEHCSERYSTCERCNRLTDDDEITWVNDDPICGTCVDRFYTSCDDCHTWMRDEDRTFVDNETICPRCLQNDYSFCEECDEYYPDENGCQGNHENDSADDDCGNCCESPEVDFIVPNDGGEPLANDTRATVTLPVGVIDDQGLARIATRLYRENVYNADQLVGEMDHRWQTKDGNFTKRLSRAVYKRDGTKLDSATVSAIGNIAREHAASTASFSIEVTRELNQPRSQFAHSDSCWWTCYSSSRCALKSNGGYGLRTFNDYGVAGRAWVMPLKQRDPIPETRGSCGCGCDTVPASPAGFTPTFDTVNAAGFVVFNGYGDLSGYVAARIVAQMVGMTYRKIDFTCAPMFINGDSAYLIAPEELAAPYTDGRLNLTVSSHASLYFDELHARTATSITTTTTSEVIHV